MKSLVLKPLFNEESMSLYVNDLIWNISVCLSMIIVFCLVLISITDTQFPRLVWWRHYNKLKTTKGHKLQNHIADFDQIWPEEFESLTTNCNILGLCSGDFCCTCYHITLSYNFPSKAATLKSFFNEKMLNLPGFIFSSVIIFVCFTPLWQ